MGSSICTDKRRQCYKAGEAAEVLCDEIPHADMPLCQTWEPFDPWKWNTHCAGGWRIDHGNLELDYGVWYTYNHKYTRKVFATILCMYCLHHCNCAASFIGKNKHRKIRMSVLLIFWWIWSFLFIKFKLQVTYHNQCQWILAYQNSCKYNLKFWRFYGRTPHHSRIILFIRVRVCNLGSPPSLWFGKTLSTLRMQNGKPLWSMQISILNMLATLPWSRLWSGTWMHVTYQIPGITKALLFLTLFVPFLPIWLRIAGVRGRLLVQTRWRIWVS